MTLPVRSAARRRPARRSVSRASATLSPGRLIAALALLASAAAIYGVTSSAAFELDRMEVRGTSYTEPETVRETLGVAVGSKPNLFRLKTSELSQALRALPTVKDAEVNVALPDRLLVTVRERSAVLVWNAAGRRLLVDAEGKLFALDQRGSGADALPVVLDRRASAQAMEVGGQVDPVDLAVVRLLAALRPAAIRSQAKRFVLAVDDAEGYTLAAEPRLWRAVFGFYTPTLRNPSLVPGQVQCLTALLPGAEKTLEKIYLARSGERCGTFTRKRAP